MKHRANMRLVRQRRNLREELIDMDVDYSPYGDDDEDFPYDEETAAFVEAVRQRFSEVPATSDPFLTVKPGVHKGTRH